MDKTLGLFDAVAVHQNADHCNSDGIHHNSQRCGREQKHGLVPKWAAVQDREQIREGQDRKQITQAGTGFCHLQLIDPQINHIAFKIHRHPGKADQPNTQFRRHPLQKDGQLPLHKLWQRQHEDQMQNRQLVPDAARPAKYDQNHAADPHNHGIGHDIGNACQIAQKRQCHRNRNHQKPGPTQDPVPRKDLGCAAQFTQEKIQRNQRDNRPMAVFWR